MSVAPIMSTETLLAAIQNGLQPTYLFFWGHRPRPDGSIGASCLSQWWAAPFTVEGITYATAEHCMMAEKARLFGDHRAYAQILAASHPEVAKKLGRTVQGFEEQRWVQQRDAIVVQGNMAKFGQHAALRRFLVQTGERILVEASPVDRVWGIGLAADAPAATRPAQWRGLNLLGFALMQVRAHLCHGTCP